MANRAKNVFSYRAVLRAGVSLRGSSDVDIALPKQCVLGKGTAAPGLTVEAMAGIHDQRPVGGDVKTNGATLAASQVRHQDFLLGGSHVVFWPDLQERGKSGRPADRFPGNRVLRRAPDDTLESTRLLQQLLSSLWSDLLARLRIHLIE